MGSHFATAMALGATIFLATSTPANAQAIDTVRAGSGALQSAHLPLGTFGIESFVRSDGVDTPTSTTTQTIRRDRQGDQDAYVVETRHVSQGDTTHSSIVIRANDFALLHHRVKAAHDSAAVSASAGHLTGWVALPDQPVLLLDIALDNPVFPIEGQMPWLFPLLPLQEGYAAAIPHFSEWNGSEQWMTIRVVGSEQIDHGGEQRACWKIDAGETFPGFSGHYWVDKETREILRSSARATDGSVEYWARARAP